MRGDGCLPFVASLGRWVRTSRYRDDMLSPGDQAPEFSVPAHDGTTVSLSTLTAPFVVMWFYPEADTPG
jgi:hypothetical protein